MSYASKLAAMSRGHVPAVRVHGDAAEAPREELVEVPVSAPPPVHTAPPVVAAPRPVAPAVATTRVDVPAAQSHDAPPATVVHHHTVEHHTTVEASAPPPVPLASPPPRAALPPQAEWLAEDVQVSDPLVESADTDALRELMRTVRQWTSSPPTVIEAPPPAAETVTPVAVVPPPNQVSIGNVTITVEDAPPARTERAAAPVRNTSDRMARNHIRDR